MSGDSAYSNSGGASVAPNMGALLSALSTVLSDTLGRFEEISGRVTENVLTRGGSADHDLVVALQDFDRLQQEFAALGQVISQCAKAAATSENGEAAAGHQAIARITLTDIKERLLDCLQRDDAGAVVAAVGSEQVF